MRWIAASVCVSFAACGPPGDASTSDGHTIDATVDAAIRPFQGFLLFANRQLPSGAASLAIADFREDGPALVETGLSGTCSSFTFSTAAPVSAGDLLVEGGASTFTLGFDASAGYRPTAALPVPLFAEADMLIVTAPGDQTGPFGGFARVKPRLAGVSMPPALSRSASATFTWTGEIDGEIWIWLRGPGGATDAGFLFCRAPDTGSVTISAEQMAFFPAAYAAATPSVMRVDEVRVTTDDTVARVTAAWEVVGAESPVD